MHTYYTITSNTDGNLASDQPPKTIYEIRSEAKAVHVLPAEGDFERWYFQAVGSGGVIDYAIINKRNQLALTVQNDSLAEGAPFVLQPYTGSQSQKFMLIPASNGQCLISALSSGKYLTVDGPPRMIGSPAPVTQNVPGVNGHNLWELNPIPCDPYPGQPYRLLHRLSGLVVGIRSASQTAAERARLLAATDMGEHTKVQFSPVSNNSNVYNILFRHSGQMMNIHQGKVKKTTPVTQNTPSGLAPHEQFYLETTPDGWCMLAPIHSRRYLGGEWEKGNTYPEGSKVIQLYQTAAPEQHFRLEHFGFVPEQNTPYRLKNLYTGKYLEVNLGSAADMAAIAQNKYSGDSSHQEWSFKPLENSINAFQIEARHSRMVLTAENANDGTPIVQRPPQPGDKQSFMLLDAASNENAPDTNTNHVFRIVSVPTQKVLMPIGRNQGDCVGVALADRNDADPAQEWVIERNGSG